MRARVWPTARRRRRPQRNSQSCTSLSGKVARSTSQLVSQLVPSKSSKLPGFLASSIGGARPHPSTTRSPHIGNERERLDARSTWHRNIGTSFPDVKTFCLGTTLCRQPCRGTRASSALWPPLCTTASSELSYPVPRPQHLLWTSVCRYMFRARPCANLQLTASRPLRGGFLHPAISVQQDALWCCCVADSRKVSHPPCLRILRSFSANLPTPRL